MKQVTTRYERSTYYNSNFNTKRKYSLVATEKKYLLRMFSNFHKSVDKLRNKEFTLINSSTSLCKLSRGQFM